ncbi:endonuclease/exonuclease/phosphatase family protein [Brevibacillus sp. GCM10020057]|uniref:endonuclease/exonuclease/phosphatase family protein n=1 Tax=Brevibacillus sp. GCM10020057 TaxID=3317327 RepID=UPI00362E43F3
MRKKWLPLSLCFTLFFFPSGGTVVRNLADLPPPSVSLYAQPLTVVTYNTRGCRTDAGSADPALIVAALRPLAADIIALQEVDVRLPRSQFVNQIAAIASALKMNYAFGPSIDFAIGSYGNAVLSKFPILHAKTIPLPAEWEPRSLLDVTVDWNGAPLHVLATHLGVKQSEHGEQIESLQTYLQEKSYNNSVLLGDFNMLPGDSLFASLRTLYTDTLFDENIVLRTLKGTGAAKQIDRIMHTPDLACLEASAPAVGPSDHYPVLMKLARAAFPSPHGDDRVVDRSRSQPLS